MKTFIRIKKIKGNEYIYEITPYYDPATKKIRHKSKYLGKNIQGSPHRVRQKIPIRAYSYGEYVILSGIIEELGIRGVLKNYMTEAEIEVVLSLAINRAVCPLAMNNISTWYEGVYFYKPEYLGYFSSQRLSRLLEKVGKSSLSQETFRYLINKIGTKRTLIYDVTSLSSYSRLMEIVEWGYNRDGDILPQVNLSVIVDRDYGIAVMYEIYPGSIVDVSTLIRTVKMLRDYGVRDSVFILDRGFFSTENIRLLQESGIRYIIAVPLSLKAVKKAISSLSRRLNDPNNMKFYANEPVFVVDIEIPIGEMKVKGYCYYNPKRKKEEEDGFLRKLYEIKAVIENKEIRDRKQLRGIVKDVAGVYERYLKVSFYAGKVGVRFRNNAVSQRINRMGKFIILSNTKGDWKELLENYRSKDMIEKAFEMLKNDIEMYTPGMHKENTLRGLMFVGFISLILRMRLMKMMASCGLNERYSLKGLLLELSKIKMIELSDGQRIATEYTKKQKEIFNKLNLCA